MRVEYSLGMSLGLQKQGLCVHVNIKVYRFEVSLKGQDRTDSPIGRGPYLQIKGWREDRLETSPQPCTVLLLTATRALGPVCSANPAL